MESLAALDQPEIFQPAHGRQLVGGRCWDQISMSPEPEPCRCVYMHAQLRGHATKLQDDVLLNRPHPACVHAERASELKSFGNAVHKGALLHIQHGPGRLSGVRVYGTGSSGDVGTNTLRRYSPCKERLRGEPQFLPGRAIYVPPFKLHLCCFGLNTLTGARQLWHIPFPSVPGVVRWRVEQVACWC